MIPAINVTSKAHNFNLLLCINNYSFYHTNYTRQLQQINGINKNHFDKMMVYLGIILKIVRKLSVCVQSCSLHEFLVNNKRNFHECFKSHFYNK